MKKYKAVKNLNEGIAVKKSIWKNKKMLWLIAGFIVVLMVGSVLTLMFEGGDNGGKEIDYNGHKFVYNDQKGWVTTINGQQVAFEVLPSDLEGIKKESGFGLSFGKTYVTFNPSEFSENSNEISRLLGFLSLAGRQAFPACTSEQGCSDLPIVDCNKTGTNNVVYIKSGNETLIKQDGNCLILEAKPGEEFKVVTLFIYQLFGIVN